MSDRNDNELAPLKTAPLQAAPPKSSLQRLTPARIALARTGSALSTPSQLQFQLDHARARDAVHDHADLSGLAASLRSHEFEALQLESAVEQDTSKRTQYLRRPDLGRRLSASSADLLATLPPTPREIVVVIADGLSGLAIDRHALPLIQAMLAAFPPDALRQAPICLVRNGRVAIADEIGGLLHAKLSILLIGERPGLSAPDSLGVYLTSNPQPGRTDAERNCISNIRLEGLSYPDAAQRILFYTNAARASNGTGFALKDTASPTLPPMR